MVQILNKILAIILALIVLFSTLSFTVEKHVCMDEVTDVSFFGEAEACEMMDTDECELPKTDQNTVDQEDCCDDITMVIPGNDIPQKAIDQLDVEHVQFIIAYTFTYLTLLEDQANETPYFSYKPPTLPKNIQVLYQTFLI